MSVGSVLNDEDRIGSDRIEIGCGFQSIQPESAAELLELCFLWPFFMHEGSNLALTLYSHICFRLCTVLYSKKEKPKEKKKSDAKGKKRGTKN